jgi:hypothetical protein
VGFYADLYVGFSTPGVLNFALRVLILVIRVLNLVPRTQYPVLYRENFTSGHPQYPARLAQSVERTTLNPVVAVSRPTACINSPKKLLLSTFKLVLGTRYYIGKTYRKIFHVNNPPPVKSPPPPGTGSIKGVKKREAKERDPKEKEGTPS